MPANLRLEGNFLELVKDYLFISDVKASAEHSDEVFKSFHGILLKGLAFLLLILLISIITSAFVTSLKQKKFRETILSILFSITKVLG